MTDDPDTPTSAPTAPPPEAAPPAAPPAAEWGVLPQPATPRRSRRAVITVAVAAVVLVLGLVGFLTTRHSGSSTDGSFSTGNCVALTSSQVRLAPCGGTHDGRITAVLHQSYETCPSGSDEFDVTDNTGNLCVDRSDSQP